MQHTLRLSDLPLHQTAAVLTVDANGGIYQRLLDIGLTEGTHVSCVLRSPMGDPSAYLIRGAVFALRRDDASCVTVATGAS